MLRSDQKIRMKPSPSSSIGRAQSSMTHTGNRAEMEDIENLFHIQLFLQQWKAHKYL